MNVWSWGMVNYKWFPGHKWLFNQPMIMELHTHESRMCPKRFWGQKITGQGHGTLMIENVFGTITDSVIHLWSWNVIHLLPMSQGCALLISGTKGQRSRSLGTGDWKWFPDYNWLWNPYMIMKLHTLTLPMGQGCALLILGSKGQGHRALVIENGFRTITDYVIHLLSWNFIHLLPRSQGMSWLLMIENGFWTITDSVIHLKRDTLAPHESRICSIDFWVNRSRSWA